MKIIFPALAIIALVNGQQQVHRLRNDVIEHRVSSSASVATSTLFGRKGGRELSADRSEGSGGSGDEE
jgi:hypothetical protein